MDEQKIAYIPIIAPDAFTMPSALDEKLLSDKANSFMPLIRSIDKSVCGLKDDLWTVKKETNNSIAELKQDISALKEDAREIKSDMRVMNERIDKNLAQYEAIANEMRGDIKAMNARLDTQQTRFGWYLTIFGLIITVVVATIQMWK